MVPVASVVAEAVDSIAGLVVCDEPGSPPLNAVATVPIQQHVNKAGAANRSSTLGNGSLSRPGSVGNFTAAIMA